MMENVYGYLKKDFFYTVEKYLEMERASERTGTNTFDGYVYKMARRKPEHSRINAIWLAILVAQPPLENPAEAALPKYENTQRPFFKEPKDEQGGCFLYACVLWLVCGEPHFMISSGMFLINPIVIIEIPLNRPKDSIEAKIPPLLDAYRVLAGLRVGSSNTRGFRFTRAIRTDGFDDRRRGTRRRDSRSFD